ncbi:MAG: type II CAAX endopeptidase family protein [Candidatus Thorarchaeota archaeon]|jgi:membrane protease YdiL (CAAX protease family)
MEHAVREALVFLQSAMDEYVQEFLEWSSSHASFMKSLIIVIAVLELFIIMALWLNRAWIQSRLQVHTKAEKIFIISFFSLVISGSALLIMGIGLLTLNYAGEFSLVALLATGLNALLFLISLIACLPTFLLLFAHLFISRMPTQPLIPDDVNWGGTPMLVIVIAFFIISFMVTLFSSTAGSYASSLALILLPLYLVVVTYERSPDIMGFRIPTMKWLLLVIPALPVLLFSNELIYTITERILGQFPLEELMEQIITEDPLLMGINTGVVGPIGEEVFFRGFVYTGLRRKFGVRGGIFWSSLFFGLTHGIPWQIPYAFVAGIILAYVYEKTGSLYSPIILHVVNNSLSVIGIIS